MYSVADTHAEAMHDSTVRFWLTLAADQAAPLSTNIGAKAAERSLGMILWNSQSREKLRLKSTFGMSDLKIEEDPRERVSFGY